jgi:hypothetical protein
MGIRPELWLNDSVKGTKLPTSCITLLKHAKEFCWFFKKSESTIRLLDERLFSDLKVAPGMKSHDYYVLLTQMIAIGIQNILPINVREAIIIRTRVV